VQPPEQLEGFIFNGTPDCHAQDLSNCFHVVDRAQWHAHCTYACSSKSLQEGKKGKKSTSVKKSSNVFAHGQIVSAFVSRLCTMVYYMLARTACCTPQAETQPVLGGQLPPAMPEGEKGEPAVGRGSPRIGVEYHVFPASVVPAPSRPGEASLKRARRALPISKDAEKVRLHYASCLPDALWESRT